MASNGNISLTVTLDSGQTFKVMAKDINGVKSALNGVLVESEHLNKKALNFAAISTGIAQARDSINQLTSTLGALSEVYKGAAQTQTQLTTVMRQRMDASEADVQSINNVISAQSKLGVLGATIQRRGAQQIATFLKERSSLETLIPAMNNLVAQQKGVNATQEDAYGVANLMGKAMQGQTSALRRVGITFTAAEESVMKYGNETQRAAMLSQIITNNVGQMNAELGKTDFGKQKQLENRFGAIKVAIGKVTQSMLPYLSMAANFTVLTANIGNAVGAIKLLGTSLMTLTLKTRLVSAATMLWSRVTAAASIVVRALQPVLIGATTAATALRVALMSLGITAVAAAAFTAISYALDAFSKSSHNAAGSAKALQDVEDREKQRAEDAKASRDAEAQSLVQVRSALQINIQRLKEFHGSKVQEKAIVEQMNDTYGETMGYFSKVSDWYNALVKNSATYCRQMVIEAKARRLANQIAEKEQDVHDIRYDAKGNARRYSKQQRVEFRQTGGRGEQEAYVVPSDLERANAKIASLNKEIAATTKQLDAKMKALGKLAVPVKGSSTKPNLDAPKPKPKKEKKESDTDKLVEGAKSAKDLEHNLSVYQARLAALDPAQKAQAASLNKLIDLTKKAAQAAKEATSAIDYANPKNLDEVTAAIERQQALRKHANKETIKGYDAEIQRLSDLKEAIEMAGHVEVPIDQIKNGEQLNRELSYYNTAFNKATEQEKAGINERIKALNKLKEKWDDARAAMNKPADISELGHIDELGKAINYYGELQSKQSADEIYSTQKVIGALQRKKEALDFGTKLADMEHEISKINALPDKEYGIKVRAIGVDAIKDKIDEIDERLNDLDNPPTDGMRAAMIADRQELEKMANVAGRSFGKLQEGWEGIKGIGGSIEGITQALDGNANAWQRITGLIDSFISIATSIATVVDVLSVFSKATAVDTTAKEQNAAAAGAQAGATAAAATGSAAAATATVPLITANKAATASFMELAAASFYAANATIPLVGFGIATGFVAAATASVKAAGAVTAFAKGGVISGPTVGLMGEYPGASHNPEVVAPLDKLRGMLKSDNVAVGGSFRVRGRDLVAVLANETQISGKSGKRTNIKI